MLHAAFAAMMHCCCCSTLPAAGAHAQVVNAGIQFMWANVNNAQGPATVSLQAGTGVVHGHAHACRALAPAHQTPCLAYPCVRCPAPMQNATDGTTNPAVRLAIIDTGIQIDHPDLRVSPSIGYYV